MVYPKQEKKVKKCQRKADRQRELQRKADQQKKELPRKAQQKRQHLRKEGHRRNRLAEAVHLPNVAAGVQASGVALLPGLLHQQDDHPEVRAAVGVLPEKAVLPGVVLRRVSPRGPKRQKKEGEDRHRRMGWEAGSEHTLNSSGLYQLF